jgi:hypothetical protein
MIRVSSASRASQHVQRYPRRERSWVWRALQAGAVVRDARGPHRLYESAVRRLFATTGGCVTVAAFGAEFVRVGEGLESRKFPLPRSRCHEAIMRAL